MKAVVFKEANKLAVENVPEPVANPNEVVVKVKDVGICGSDLHFCSFGLVPPDTIMGHEVTGTVASVGKEVVGWKEGDRMLLYFGAPCGRCAACRLGNTHLCWDGAIVGNGIIPGGFAEYFKVPPEMLIPIPAGTDMRDASLADPVATTYRAVLLSGISPGDTALVMGAGPIGLCLTQHLKAKGIEQVVLSEPVEKRARLGEELGADVVLDPKKHDVDAECKRLTDGLGPDFVFDCVGTPETVLAAPALVRPAGKVVWVGVCMEPLSITPVMWMLKEIALVTSLGFTKAQMEKGLELIRTKNIVVDKLISEIISIDQVPEAFERLMKPNDEVKIVAEF